MRVSTLIIALSSVLLLANFAGCGFRPSRGPVLKPAGLEKAPETEVSDGLAWTKLDGYDAAHPSLPANGPVKKLNLPVVYEEATVFPVDGDATPYEDGKYDFTKPIERLPAVVSDDGVAGGVSQQVFFGNGSAKLSLSDRRKLKTLAEDILQAAHDYKVRVVGHASKGPAGQQKANLAMAQKRADDVAAELQKDGVKPHWLFTSAEEDNMPGAPARRVDIFVEARNQISP